MKHRILTALVAFASGLLFAACAGNQAEEIVLDTLPVESLPVADTVKYFGNGFAAESTAEYLLVGDQLVSVVEGEQAYDNLDAQVYYGETIPEELGTLAEGATLLHGTVIDRMNHGEKNNCWIVVKSIQ